MIRRPPRSTLFPFSSRSRPRASAARWTASSSWARRSTMESSIRNASASGAPQRDAKGLGDRPRDVLLDPVHLVVRQRPVLGLEGEPPREAPPAVREAEDVEERHTPEERSRLLGELRLDLGGGQRLLGAEDKREIALDRGAAREPPVAARDLRRRRGAGQ